MLSLPFSPTIKHICVLTRSCLLYSCSPSWAQVVKPTCDISLWSRNAENEAQTTVWNLTQQSATLKKWQLQGLLLLLPLHRGQEGWNLVQWRVPASPHLAQGQEMVSVSTDEGNSLTAPGPQQRNFLFGEVPTGKAKRLRKERIKSGDGKRVFHCVHCLEDRLFIRSTVTSSSLLSHYSIM